jgi:anti-sigma regulatory factor (Ser/Thr protein kinase)
MSVTVEELTSSLPPEPFRHEALLYAGDEQFVEGCTIFVRDGIENGDPTLVVAVAEKLDRLREALGPDAERVQFADMAAVGRNPAWIIPAWQDFVEENAADGLRLRGIGEPIFPARDPHELVECERHEALLNLAFADADRFWLLCPYDTEALPPEVIEEARRNHPFVANGSVRESSLDYRGAEAIAAPFDLQLPEPPPQAAKMAFGHGQLAALRQFVGECAASAGMSLNRALDLVVAANEIATNSLEHGGGSGVLRIWAERRKMACEIRDSGTLEDPLGDRRPPSVDNPAGRGLWLANQLCDLVQVRTRPGEMVVRLHLAFD